MKSYILVIKTNCILFIAYLTVFSCTPVSNEKQMNQMAANSVVMQEKNQSSTPLLEAELPKDQVCMVNNTFMGKKQIPVTYENKTYYGCCEMCVDKIKMNKAVRYATDPLTGKEVDKAIAFISLNPTTHDGTVLYFESEDSFKHYKSKCIHRVK